MSGFLIDTNVLSEYNRTGDPDLGVKRWLPAVDSLLAATALAYDLIIVTRNVRDFEGTDVATLNPWES